MAPPRLASSQIISPFHGEMLYSLAIRRRRLELGESNVVEMFFPNRKASFTTSLRLPLPVNPLMDIGFDVMWAIHNATAWPLWSLGTGLSLKYALGRSRTTNFSRGLVRESYLKFCPACAKKQRQNYFISWWERNCNLPLMAACPVHGISLCVAPIEKVVCGFLPHELLDVAIPVVSRVDERSMSIAHNIIELCEASPNIDTGVALDFAKLSRDYVVNASLFEKALGASSEYILEGKLVPYERLFSSGPIEDFIASLVVGNDASIHQLRKASTLKNDWFFDVAPKALAKIIPLATSRTSGNRYAQLIERCRKTVVMDPTAIRMAPYLRPTWCIHLLLLHHLERGLLSYLLKNKTLPDKNLHPLIEWRSRAGMYVLLKACEKRNTESTERRPDVQELIKHDCIIPDWQDSFIGMCARNIDYYLSRPGNKRCPDLTYREEEVFKPINAVLYGGIPKINSI